MITGATGFIGSALVEALSHRGECVIAVARRPPQSASPGTRWVEADIRHFNGWPELLDGVRTVYHLAWSSLPASSNNDPVGDASDNVIGSLQLLEAVKAKPDIRFVFASSGGTVYGPLQTGRATEMHPTRPNCAYGVSKLAVENYINLYASLWGLNGVSLRMSNPFGPTQDTQRNFGAVTTFIRRALAGEAIPIYGNGAVIRDFLYISDVVDALIAARQIQGGAPVLNIGSGIGHSLIEVVETIAAVLGRRVPIRYLPARQFDVPVSVLDISLAYATMSWAPKVKFYDGVAATAADLQRTLPAAQRAPG